MPEKCERSGATLSATPWKRRPAADPDADRGDLVLGDFARRRAACRGARPRRRPGPCASRPRRRTPQRLDQPAFERRHIGAHVRPAALEVEHDIGDPLARPVIGELPAAAGAIDRKARVDEVLGLGAGPGGVERRDARRARRARRPRRRAIASARASISASASWYWVSPGVNEPFDRRRVAGANKGARGARCESSMDRPSIIQRSTARAATHRRGVWPRCAGFRAAPCPASCTMAKAA